MNALSLLAPVPCTCHAGDSEPTFLNSTSLSSFCLVPSFPVGVMGITKTLVIPELFTTKLTVHKTYFSTHLNGLTFGYFTPW